MLEQMSTKQTIIVILVALAVFFAGYFSASSGLTQGFIFHSRSDVSGNLRKTSTSPVTVKTTVENLQNQKGESVGRLILEGDLKIGNKASLVRGSGSGLILHLN